MDKNPNIRGRFERQRRNLNIISVVLIVYSWLGITIEEINILGNRLLVDEPGGVEALLWILFVYFLLRFYQFYKVVDNKEFSSSYYSYLSDAVKEKAFRVAAKDIKDITAVPLRTKKEA